MSRIVAFIGWLSFSVWLLSSPGCGGLEAGWRLDGIPEETAQAALDEWCQVGGYCDTTNPNGDNLMQVDWQEDGTNWWGEHRHINNNRTHWIVVSYRAPADRLRVLLMHELGHYFRGRGHLPNGNVMAHYLDDCAEHLTEADIYGNWVLP